MRILPGNTDLSSYNKDNPVLTPLVHIESSRVILLASNHIDESNIFLNGLSQNILILYDLFETLGYKSYLIQHKPQTQSSRKCMNKYDILYSDELIKTSLNICLYIEIGMSLDSISRSYLKSIGAKIVKIYLGNILNIDIETIQNMPSIFFNHHIAGEQDEIWMSPHYKQNLEYGLIINKLPLTSGKIVPYVWDPCFITQYYTKFPKWIAPKDWRNSDIVITDPNISFQKAYLYPLLLAESFSLKYPEWKGKVIIVNGDRVNMQIYSLNTILPQLDLYKKNRIVLQPRKNIHKIMEENSSATFITCQWNNAFNYMTLELMYCDFPILHNSDGWGYGYHYSLDKFNEAIDMLHTAITTHSNKLSVYKAHAQNLAWKHSIYNPEIQAEWKSILQTL